MVRLVPGNAGVIFQLQHLLNHAHSIRHTLSLVILVPHGKTILGLARLDLLVRRATHSLSNIEGRPWRLFTQGATLDC